MKLNCEFSLDLLRAGSVDPGGLFYYKRRLWMMVNPVQGGQRLIRAVATQDQDPHVICRETLVRRVNRIRVLRK